MEDILFVELGQSEKPQLNKRQFLAKLEKLPEWLQTAYYCPRASLHECKSKNETQRQRKRWSGEKKAVEKASSQQGYTIVALSKLKLPERTIKAAAFLSQLAKKWLAFVAAWILRTLPVFFAYLIRLWKNLERKWH